MDFARYMLWGFYAFFVVLAIVFVPSLVSGPWNGLDVLIAVFSLGPLSVILIIGAYAVIISTIPMAESVEVLKGKARFVRRGRSAVMLDFSEEYTTLVMRQLLNLSGPTSIYSVARPRMLRAFLPESLIPEIIDTARSVGAEVYEHQIRVGKSFQLVQEVVVRGGSRRS